MRGKTVVVVLAVLPAIAAALGDRSNENAEVVAVRELLTAAPGGSEAPGRAVCVSRWSGTDGIARGHRVDPSSSLLAALRAAGLRAYPSARCTLDGMSVRDETGEEAVHVSLRQVRWISRDFVKTEGYWHLGHLAAQGFRMTLSRSAGRWRVDVMEPTWVS